MAFCNNMNKKVKVLVAQTCLTLFYPLDHSLPGSSVHGILQARILEWVAISFSRGSSWPKDQTWVHRKISKVKVMSFFKLSWVVDTHVFMIPIYTYMLFCISFFFFFFNFILFNFIILYWFCHISKWICHRYTCVPHPEPSSLLPPHIIPLGHPSAPAPSIQYRASNLDWRLVSYMILYIFHILPRNHLGEEWSR